MGNISGVEEWNKNKGQIVIYPNPGNGIFSLQTESEISTVEIVDMLGEIVYSSGNFSSNRIDISNRPKGIYFIRVEDKKNRVHSGKIILQ
jgi:hypothetical protein